MDPDLLVYYEAFKRSKLERRLTQRSVAQAGATREADFVAVFGYLQDDTRRLPKQSEIRSVLKCLRTYWQIVDGYLVPRTEGGGPRPTGAIQVYPDYISARIGAKVSNDGENVWLLNTYLSNYIHSPEVVRHDPGALSTWLEQGKRVRVLILHPERHSMRLRSKSLHASGEMLANRLIDALKDLLDFSRRYPDQLEVRLMDEIPGVSAVILESRLFYGLHLANGHTENGPHVEVPAHTPCKTYAAIKQHFETLWKDPQRSRELTEELIKNADHALYGVRNKLNYLYEDGGSWSLYLHNISGMLDGSGDAPFRSSFGEIMRWELEFIRPPSGIYLHARLQLPEQARRFDANLITEHLLDRDYAHLRFTSFKDITIHLSIHYRTESPGNPLLGYFIVMSGSDCCAGYIVMVKNTPTHPVVPVPTQAYFRRLLPFRDGSYMSLARVMHERERFGAKMWFAGTYRVYSYGGKKGGAKGIKINWLHIDETGTARYKNQRFAKGDELIGRATYLDPNLHIVSTYFKHDAPQRRSYMIIGVAKNEPAPGRYYGAVHLGVSWERQMANGKRFILEYTEDDFERQEPAFVPIHSPEYNRIAKPIRMLLSGRLKNLNGFLRSDGLLSDLQDLEREWAKSIRLGQVFYDSAVQHVRRGQYREAVEMLFRAINHGFPDLEGFEREVRSFDEEGLAAMQGFENYAKIKDVLFQSTESFDPGI
jgi:hypothetical protein